MSQQVEIPKELKRWNWGAFLLCPIWCIRHGIWQGWLLLIPLFGPFVPFWLGLKGNQKAWLRNRDEPVEVFLKRQKHWGVAGLIFLIANLVICWGFFLYVLNCSSDIKMGLETANSNQRLIEYFGKPIRKSSFFEGSYTSSDSLNTSIRSLAFNAIGSKNEGKLHFQWEKRGEDWVATEVAFVDSEGKTHQLVDSLTLEGSFFSREPYERGVLEEALTHMIQEREGYVILSRSKKHNDFIQTAIEILDNGTMAFAIVFSDGYTKWNKKLYQSKDLHTKDEIIKLFTLYASGNDAHINLIEWNKLTSIEPDGEHSAFFTFDEPLQNPIFRIVR